MKEHYNGLINKDYSIMFLEGRGRVSQSGQTQDIKTYSCAFRCDVPHQWISQRQVGPMYVYCEGVRCYVLCLRHGVLVWQHNDQSTTAISRQRRDKTLYEGLRAGVG